MISIPFELQDVHVLIFVAVAEADANISRRSKVLYASFHAFSYHTVNIAQCYDLR